MDRGYSAVGRSLYLNAKNNPNRPALIEEHGKRLTYGELNDTANRLANHLIANGCRKGDHVGILASNTADHIVALYGAAKAGAVSVALDPRWTTSEIHASQANIGCKFLVCEDTFMSKVNHGTSEQAGWQIFAFSRCDGLADMLGNAESGEPRVVHYDHDVSTLMLTSGTTGLPKGCVRTNRVIECSFKDVNDGLDSGTSELVVVPVYYGSGRARVMRHVFTGGTLHLMDTFDPERTAAYIGKHNIDGIALAPTMVTRILGLNNLDRFDFSSLKMLQKAGSPFPPDMAKELMSKVTPHIYQAFATSETGTVTALRGREHLVNCRLRSRLD